MIFRDLRSADEVNAVACDKRYRVFDDFDAAPTGIAGETDSYSISRNELVCPNERCVIMIGSEIGYADTQRWTVAGMKHYGLRLFRHRVFREALE